MRSPTTDAAVLIYAKVGFVTGKPSPADLWLLDAFAHLTGSARHGFRASERWPDPMPKEQVAA